MGSLICDILFIITGCLILFDCIKQGFFKTLIRFCRILLALLVAYFLGSKFAAWLSAHIFYSPIHESVFQKLQQLHQSASDGLNTEKIISAFPRFLMTDSMKNEINSMNESGDALVERASNSISSALSGIVSSIVGYLLVFLIALALLTLFGFLLGKCIHHLPILKHVDKILGGLLGILIAFCVLYLIGSVIRFFWGETDFYARSSVVRFFGDFRLTKALSFLNFQSFVSKVFQ